MFLPHVASTRLAECSWQLTLGLVYYNRTYLPLFFRTALTGPAGFFNEIAATLSTLFILPEFTSLTNGQPALLFFTGDLFTP